MLTFGILAIAFAAFGGLVGVVEWRLVRGKPRIAVAQWRTERPVAYRRVWVLGLPAVGIGLMAAGAVPCVFGVGTGCGAVHGHLIGVGFLAYVLADLLAIALLGRHPIPGLREPFFAELVLGWKLRVMLALRIALCALLWTVAVLFVQF